MKQKLILLIILILGVNASLFSQSKGIAYRFGIASYSMKTMKKFQQYSMGTLAFNTRITHEFPAWLSHRLQLSQALSQSTDMYFFYCYNSTGGRISSMDYSGEYKMDLLLNAHSIGLGTTYDFKQQGAFTYSIYFEAALLMTSLDVFEDLKVFDEKFEYDESFVAESPSFEGGLMASYALQRFVFSVNIGYLLEIPRDFHKPYSKGKLRYPGGAIKADWSGIRTGVQLAFTF